MRSRLAHRGGAVALVWALAASGAGCTRGSQGTGDAEGGAAAGSTGAAGAIAPGQPGGGAPEAAASDAATPGDPSADARAPETDLTGLLHGPESAELAAAPVKLPGGWQGTGVLARRGGRLPRRAPGWAKVVAEVTVRDGQRFLVATGRVTKVKDVQLARSTAENRARSELARWTKSEQQSGGAIREVWRDSRSGDTFAQVELPVPAQWVPGTPLAGGA